MENVKWPDADVSLLGPGSPGPVQRAASQSPDTSPARLHTHVWKEPQEGRPTEMGGSVEKERLKLFAFFLK